LNIKIGENGRMNALEIMPLVEIDNLELVEVSLTPKTYVELSWNTEQLTGEYHIYRKQDEGSFKRIGETDETNYIDDTVELGGTYTYAVSFLNEWGAESEKSNEVVVSVIDDS